MTLEFNLGPYGEACLQTSAVNRLMKDSVARPKDTRLDIGYLSLETMDEKLFAEAKRLSRAKSWQNYGPAKGEEMLIEAIRTANPENGLGPLVGIEGAIPDIGISCSGITGVLEDLAHVFDAKKKSAGIAFVQEPGYFVFMDMLKKMSYEIIGIPEDNQGMRADSLDDAFDRIQHEGRASEIRFVYATTVNNPTTTVLSEARGEALLRIAQKWARMHGTLKPLVVVDGAYDSLIHGRNVDRLASPFKYDELNQVLYARTFSKVIAPGLRMGYFQSQDCTMMNLIAECNAQGHICPSMVDQGIAVHLIPHLQDHQVKLNGVYRSKAFAVEQQIKKELIDTGLVGDCNITGGHAGFYFHITFNNVNTEEGSHFHNYVTRNTGDREMDGPPEDKYGKVFYLPGIHCVEENGGLAEKGKRSLRISYGLESVDRILPAITEMRKAAEYSLSKAAS